MFYELVSKYPVSYTVSEIFEQRFILELFTWLVTMEKRQLGEAR